jgi:hypothetical protein
MVPASDLEAQDAVYKRYQQDTEAYAKKMEKYNELTKNNPTRDYMPVFQGEKNTRRLTPAEAVIFNKESAADEDYLYNPSDLHLEEKDINIANAGKSKNLSAGGKEYSGLVRAHLSTIVKPTAPKRVEPADWSTVQLDKMPTKKATIQVPKGKLKPVAVKEEYAFQNPTKGTKTETKTSAAMTGGGDKLVRAKNPSGSLGAARVVTSEDKVVRGYKREKALFEAKAGASASGIDFSNMSASEINAKRQDLKQDRRDYRKSSLSSDIKLPSIKEATMDIRQSRKAETYSKKDTAGKLSHFTSGYKSNETPRAESRIEEFKGSMENAANRNTMQSKLKTALTKPKTNMY